MEDDKPKVHTQSDISHVAKKAELHASVHRACTNCGAPGVWHNIPGPLNDKCYDPFRAGQPIDEPHCPQCGSERPKAEHLGKIWEKTWLFGMFTYKSERPQ